MNQAGNPIAPEPGSPTPNRPGPSGAAPVRVVVLDHTAQTGGAELALLRTCAALDPTRVDVTVLLFADGPLVDRLRSLGVRVRVLPLDARVAGTDRHSAGRWAALGSMLRTVPFIARLARELRRLDPQVVHTTSLKADLIGLPAARMARRPVVWHLHDRVATDYLPGVVVRVLRTLARRADAVVVNSAATSATLPGVDTVVAYPGLAPEQIGPDPVDRQRPEPPVVGIVGRISPTKGQLEFLDAAERLAAADDRLRFRVIGDALFAEREYAQRVRDRAERGVLAGRVEFTGWVADPASALDRLSVMVHASPTPEPFGQVVAEAMARGVPVVATSGGGVDEIVRPQGQDPRGELVAPGDARGLADAATRLLADPDLAASRARQAWFGVRRDYPVAGTAQILTEVWERIARGRAPRSSAAPGPSNSVRRPADQEPAAR